MDNQRFEKVWQAADELVATGIERPTNEQVRAHLGSGSLATISPAMKAWREQELTKDAVFSEIPAPIIKEAERFVGNIWKNATKLANQRHQAAEAESDRKLEEARTELNEAFAEIQQLEATAQETRSKLDDYENRLAAQIDLLNQEKTTNKKLEIELTKVTTEAASKDALLKAAQTELSDAKANIEKLQDKLISLAGKKL